MKMIERVLCATVDVIESSTVGFEKFHMILPLREAYL